MKIILSVVVLICAAVMVTEGVDFLPTEFVPVNSLEYISQEVISLRFDLCNAQLYENCLFEAELNSPFDRWSPKNGIFIKYSILGGPGCNQTYCSNNIFSKTPQNCSFYLPPNNGPTLYMVSTAGTSPVIPSTFNLRINCTKKGSSTVGPYSGGCPTNVITTRKNLHLDHPGTVLTSPTKPVRFQFVACPSTSIPTNIRLVVSAVDQYSAFATFVCSGPICNQDNSTAFDASGSGFNFVQTSIDYTGVFSIAIYGFGEFQDVNTFNMNLQIADTSG